MLYRLYGCLINSEIVLSPCPEIKSKRKAEIRLLEVRTPIVSKGTAVHEQRYQDDVLYSKFYRVQDAFIVKLYQYGTFRISKNSRRVECYFLKNLHSEEKAVALIHHILPLVLSLKGDLILHAASFLIAGKANLVVGDPGAGKSTFAAFMHKKGFTVYSDDAVRLISKKDKFYIPPSAPFIRVLSKNKKKLVDTYNSEKKIVSISKIVFIHRDVHQKNFKQLKMLEAVSFLLPQLFRLNFHSGKLKKNELEVLHKLILNTPCYASYHKHNASSLARLRSRLANLK